MSAALHASTPVAVSSASAKQASTKARWAGRIFSGIAVLFLVFDATIKLVASQSQAVVDANTQLGWKAHHIPIIGTIEVILLVLYLIPRTAPLGAILWTGYLGGAIATHLRIDNPLFSHILFPIYVAALLWGGLYLRDARVRALVLR
jgi:DoxX-like protein